MHDLGRLATGCLLPWGALPRPDDGQLDSDQVVETRYVLGFPPGGSGPESVALSTLISFHPNGETLRGERFQDVVLRSSLAQAWSTDLEPHQPPGATEDADDFGFPWRDAQGRRSHPRFHFQWRTSGRSSPCFSMYCLCSINLSLSCCFK